MNNSYISAVNLKKSFTLGPKTIDVLKDVSLDVQEGEMLAIVGRSGTGKTTLLHVLGTLELADSGQIFYEGNDVSARSGAELDAFRNRNIGFLFQFFQLLPEFTALENVMMPLMILGRSKREARERAEAMLAEVGLDHRFDHHPNQLSGGEQQRAAFARSLVNEPKVLLADEPTGNLDLETGNRVFNLLCDLQDRRKLTTIIVTHNQEIAGHCDRVVEMEQLNG
jgi:lipoprotein-releasing system ATP-binding protein